MEICIRNEHREDDTIDNHKYLLRKLVKINKKEEYETAFYCFSTHLLIRKK